jgi:hypothetical protein
MFFPCLVCCNYPRQPILKKLNNALFTIYYLLFNMQATREYEPLVALSKTEMKYVSSKWHHAVLTAYKLRPTRDNTYDDFDFEDEEIEAIGKKYGIYPSYYEKK